MVKKFHILLVRLIAVIMESGQRKKYKELCLKEKLELLKFLENNSHRAAAERFQISKTCVSKINKRRSEYLQRSEENENATRSRKIRKTSNYDINQASFEWFKRMRGMNARVSGPMLQEVALDFSKKLGVEKFTASNGWLESFKKRHNISQKVLCGESNDVDTEIVDTFKKSIVDFMGDYKMEDVFNADECGLFYRAMPNKTLSMFGDKCKDGKISKERVTVLLACSAAGEKLKPLVIGKAKKPRCFKNVDPKNLPVLWYANSKAWMTTTIFREWVIMINKQMKQKNRNILLIIDNCPAHPNDLSFSNVKVQFLPPNTTSHLQPLDQGIIQAFKLHYRKFLLKAVISRCEECKSANEIAMSVNVLDAIMWINESWELVHISTISKCFSKALQETLCDFSESSNDDDNSDVNSISSMQYLIEQLHSDDELVNAERFLNFDDDVPSCDSLIDPESLKKEICDTFKKENEMGPISNQCETESISDDEMENEDACTPSDAEMLAMCTKMKLYALSNCPEMLNSVRKIERMTESVVLKKKRFAQKTITDFFTKKGTLL